MEPVVSILLVLIVVAGAVFGVAVFGIIWFYIWSLVKAINGTVDAESTSPSQPSLKER